MSVAQNLFSIYVQKMFKMFKKWQWNFLFVLFRTPEWFDTTIFTFKDSNSIVYRGSSLLTKEPFYLSSFSSWKHLKKTVLAGKTRCCRFYSYLIFKRDPLTTILLRRRACVIECFSKNLYGKLARFIISFRLSLINKTFNRMLTRTFKLFGKKILMKYRGLKISTKQKWYVSLRKCTC